jgi:beta-mannosidase
MTVGPWRPIALHTYSARLSDVVIRSSLDTEGAGTLSVDVELSEKISSATAKVEVLSSTIAPAEISIKDGKARAEFTVKKGDIELWFPIGYGSQKLYEIKVDVIEVKCEYCCLVTLHH